MKLRLRHRRSLARGREYIQRVMKTTKHTLRVACLSFPPSAWPQARVAVRAAEDEHVWLQNAAEMTHSKARPAKEIRAHIQNDMC